MCAFRAELQPALTRAEGNQPLTHGHKLICALGASEQRVACLKFLAPSLERDGELHRLLRRQHDAHQAGAMAMGGTTAPEVV